MANVVSYKHIKIKPENEVAAEGTIVKCRYAGSTSVGMGFLAKTTHLYKVFIQVPELEKPLVLKVKEKQGWNVDVVNQAKTVGKMFGGNKPVNEGDRIRVIYDRTKPKKCNVPE